MGKRKTQLTWGKHTNTHLTCASSCDVFIGLRQGRLCRDPGLDLPHTGEHLYSPNSFTTNVIVVRNIAMAFVVIVNSTKGVVRLL